MRIRTTLACLATLMSLATTAGASDLYNTLSNAPTAVYDSVSGNTADAQFFKTTSDHVITSIISSWVGSGLTGNVGFTINSDNAGVPGSSVASVGSLNLATLVSNTPTPISFTSLSINLSPNTNYWLVMSASNATSGGGLAYSQNPTGTG